MADKSGLQTSVPAIFTQMGERQRICGDVLLVPMHMSGHINPMMYMAKKLMQRGLTCTMMLAEGDTETMKSHMESEGMELFHLEVVGRRKDFHSPEPAQILRNSETFGLACEAFLQRILADQQAGGDGPKCMIADQFMGWSQKWATKLNIPRYVSIVSPATFGYGMYNHSDTVKKGILETGDNPVLALPGIPPLHVTDFTTSAMTSPEFLISSGDTFDESAGLLMNTFYDLEAPAIDAFGAQMKGKGVDTKLLPIGPMLPPEFFSDGVYKGSSKDPECLQWLDGRPASSVLYVAFGSAGSISPPQIVELAHGLEASGVPFLWVLLMKSRKETVENSLAFLPDGFLERTKDRGLVYPKFAPQLQILSHPATAGFLTHCGWNSTLESISRGVAMIAWPMGAEQKLCCRVIVDQAQVATEVRVNLEARKMLEENHDMVSGAEVEAAVKHFMKSPEGEKLKKRVLEMQSLARAAMRPGGSSTENFETLVKDVQGNKSKIPQAQS